jgi:hypothetical protein
VVWCVSRVDRHCQVGLGLAEDLDGGSAGAWKAEEEFAFGQVQAVGDAAQAVSCNDAQAIRLYGVRDARVCVPRHVVCDSQSLPLERAEFTMSRRRIAGVPCRRLDVQALQRHLLDNRLMFLDVDTVELVVQGLSAFPVGENK